MQEKLSDITTTAELIEIVKEKLEPTHNQIRAEIAKSEQQVQGEIKKLYLTELVEEDYFGPNDECKHMKDYVLNMIHKTRKYVSD